MKKIKLTYIIAETSLLLTLAYIALNINVEADYYEEIGYASKIVSGFGLAMIFVASSSIAGSFKKLPVPIFLLVWGFNFFALDVGFGYLASNASSAEAMGASAKVIAIDTLPEEMPLTDRLSFFMDLKDIDPDKIAKIISDSTQNDVSGLLTRRSIADNTQKFVQQYNVSSLRDCCMENRDLINKIELSYITHLAESKKLYNKVRGGKQSFSSMINEKIEKLTATDNLSPVSSKIWLWYLVAEYNVSDKWLRAVRTSDFDDLISETLFKPIAFEAFNSTNVKFDSQAFSKHGSARAVGEDLYLLWLMITLGIAIGTLSLALNTLALVIDLAKVK